MYLCTLLMSQHFQGIEAVAETLEQLWISYNQIDKLKPIRSLTKLQVSLAQHEQRCSSIDTQV